MLSLLVTTLSLGTSRTTVLQGVVHLVILQPIFLPPSFPDQEAGIGFYGLGH